MNRHQQIYVKLPATTIVETLVALILLSVAFSVGMMIYLNVIQTGTPYLKSKAHTFLKNEMVNTIEQEMFFADEYEKNGFLIQRKLSPNANSRRVHTLTIIASTPNSQQVGELKRIVYQP